MTTRIDETINTWFLKYVEKLFLMLFQYSSGRVKKEKNGREEIPQKKEFSEAGSVWCFKLFQDVISEFSEME